MLRLSILDIDMAHSPSMHKILYFTFNTTMLFLPGTLYTNINVPNASRVTIRCEHSSDKIDNIVHNWSVGFNFTNMMDFNIYSLAFTSYNKSLDPGSHSASKNALLYNLQSKLLFSSGLDCLCCYSCFTMHLLSMLWCLTDLYKHFKHELHKLLW